MAHGDSQSKYTSAYTSKNSEYKLNVLGCAQSPHNDDQRVTRLNRHFAISKQQPITSAAHWPSSRL